MRQAGAAGQALSIRLWKVADPGKSWRSSRSHRPEGRQGASAGVELTLGFLLGIKGVRGSMPTAAPGTWPRAEQRAVPAMGAAAPALLVLLGLTAAVCDAQNTCPGECGTNPATLRQPVSSPP